MDIAGPSATRSFENQMFKKVTNTVDRGYHMHDQTQLPQNFEQIVGNHLG